MNEEPNKPLQIITRPENGQLTEKEQLAIEMRYLGKTSEEIGLATGYSPSYTRQLFMSAGRLEKAYREYALRQQVKGQDQADQVLSRVRVEAPHAAERMISLSKNANNEAAIFKANEFLLNVAGVESKINLKSFFQSKSREQAEKLVDELFSDLFGQGLSSKKFQVVIQKHCPKCNPSPDLPGSVVKYGKEQDES